MTIAKYLIHPLSIAVSFYLFPFINDLHGKILILQIL
jgi:hypothetical protein